MATGRVGSNRMLLEACKALAAPAPAEEEEEQDTFDAFFARALKLGVVSEALLDELTDSVAGGETTESELQAKYRPVVQAALEATDQSIATKSSAERKAQALAARERVFAEKEAELIAKQAEIAEVADQAAAEAASKARAAASLAAKERAAEDALAARERAAAAREAEIAAKEAALAAKEAELAARGEKHNGTTLA
eukprot:1290479-Prymnesium_polylepis.1